MKQRMTTNNLKDENTRLKTRLQMIENTLQRKDKLIDDLIQAQEANYGMPNNKRSVPSGKGEQTHLILNLKKKIRDLISEKQVINEDVERLKRNIRSTKLTEVEAEVKIYMEECARLRHQLEEVIKSKDTFADPQEIKMIEEKFQ